jgi:hypothetical protein
VWGYKTFDRPKQEEQPSWPPAPDMRSLTDSCGLLFVCIGGLVAVLGLAFNPTWRDWSHQLRVVRTLSLVAALEYPGEFLDLWEVVVVDENLYSDSCVVAFSRTDRPQELCFLFLEAPLGELTARCAAWRDLRTPLLLDGDVLGEAILHGPDGCLIGRVTAWNESQPTDVGPPR